MRDPTRFAFLQWPTEEPSISEAFPGLSSQYRLDRFGTGFGIVEYLESLLFLEVQCRLFSQRVTSSLNSLQPTFSLDYNK